MRTTLRKIGNSRGVIIPAALLAECRLSDTIELRLEGSRLIIEPVETPRAGWFDEHTPADDIDAWEGLGPDADASDWEW
jgi:antitoxin MazE